MAKTREQTKPATPLRAADLIAQCEARATTRNLPSAAALRELEAVMAHNDRVGRKSGARVTIPQALELLRSHGWMFGEKAFETMIRQQYRRGWEK